MLWKIKKFFSKVKNTEQQPPISNNTLNWLTINWLKITSDFSEWFATYKKGYSCGWIKEEDGSILHIEDSREWQFFISCRNFNQWIAIFQRKDWQFWFVWADGKIIADGFGRCLYKEGEHFFIKNQKIGKLKDTFKNWIAVFISDNLETQLKEWWVNSKWFILSDWFDKCFPFDEDIKWYAKFVFMWDERYINTKFELSESFKIKPINWLNGYFLAKNINWAEIYIDTLWKQWESVESRKWIVYVKKDWKWYIASLIKK
jgi:hypothetical protein